MSASFLIFGLLLLSTTLFILNSYKHCPSNKILVVYGKYGNISTFKYFRKGGTLVLPLIQDYCFLSLEPMITNIEINDAQSKDKIDFKFTSTINFCISTESEIMINATERLLGLSKEDIIAQAKEIFISQLYLAISNYSFDEIKSSRQVILDETMININSLLNKVGLEILNINIKDIVKI